MPDKIILTSGIEDILPWLHKKKDRYTVSDFLSSEGTQNFRIENSSNSHFFLEKSNRTQNLTEAKVSYEREEAFRNSVAALCKALQDYSIEHPNIEGTLKIQLSNTSIGNISADERKKIFEATAKQYNITVEFPTNPLLGRAPQTGVPPSQQIDNTEHNTEQDNSVSINPKP